MENRSRLAYASVAAGLVVLLLFWPPGCLADQSTPAEGEESLTERANDPTATLTQVQIKDEYTPSEYGTNAQPNTLILAGHPCIPTTRAAGSRTDHSPHFSDRDQAARERRGDPHRIRGHAIVRPVCHTLAKFT